MFDGVEVGRIRGKIESGGASACNKIAGFGGWVKGRMVQDDDVLRVEQWAKLTFQPAVEEVGLAGPLKQPGGGEIAAFEAGGHQRGSWAGAARAQTMNRLTSRCPTVTTGGFAFEAAFVDGHKLLASTVVALTKAQRVAPLPGVALPVSPVFFATDPPFLTGVMHR